jgi:hypothetical protein
MVNLGSVPIECRLARRRDEAANFASRSAGIGSGTAEAKVLGNLSGARIGRAIVATSLGRSRMFRSSTIMIGRELTLRVAK